MFLICLFTNSVGFICMFFCILQVVLLIWLCCLIVSSGVVMFGCYWTDCDCLLCLVSFCLLLGDFVVGFVYCV